MLKFSEIMLNEMFLAESATMYDSLQGTKPEETERHRKQYYDDSNEEGHFHKSDGLYVLDRDRKDLHDKYGSGKQVKLTSIQKLPDRNGVVRYHGITEHGHAIPMSHFKKPAINRAGKNQQSLEQEQVAFLQKAIEEKMAANGHRPIRIRTPDGGIHEVTGIKQVQGGWPKADAFLHDKEGKPVHWMSLKGDKFQQWGGYKDLENSPLMQTYLDKLRDHKETIAPGEKYVPKGAAHHITLNPEDADDRDLLYKSMYGRDHGGEYGLHNVHAIYSGNTIGLKETEPDIHELDPTALYVNRNDNTSDVSKAKILVTHRSGMNQQGSGGRVMITHMGNVGNSRDIDTGERAVPTKKSQIAAAVAKPEQSSDASASAPIVKRKPAAPVARETPSYGVAGDNPDSPMHNWKGSSTSGEHGGQKFYADHEKPI